MKPSLGRIVLVRTSSYPSERPAIIVTVHGDECISVQAFGHDTHGAQLETSLMLRKNETDLLGWRWPPRVE